MSQPILGVCLMQQTPSAIERQQDACTARTVSVTEAKMPSWEGIYKVWQNFPDIVMYPGTGICSLPIIP